VSHPITHVIEQLIGLDGATESEVQEALWAMTKPLKEVTLADVAEEIRRRRAEAKENPA
jgi:hypothetical protein